MDLDLLDDLQEDIENEMNDAQQNLDKGKDVKANEGQKKASDKMKQMQEGLNAQMEAQKKKEAGENIDTLRSILFNLMRLSFRQESIMIDMPNVLEYFWPYPIPLVGIVPPFLFGIVPLPNRYETFVPFRQVEV